MSTIPIPSNVTNSPGLDANSSGGLSFWYSPVQINFPTYVKDIESAFNTVHDIFTPLVQLQSTVIDAFAPILQAFTRKVDVFNESITFLKTLLNPLVADLMNLIQESGFYVLIILPEIITKYYLWVPQIAVTDPITKVTTIQRTGGFFSLTAQQYALFQKSASSYVGQAPFFTGQPISTVGQKIAFDQASFNFSLKDATGKMIKADPSISTVFTSAGSNGISGTVKSFNDSFIAMGSSILSTSASGNLSDIAIPQFKQGDIVSGLSFLVSLPGLNNFFDALFAFANLFVSGNTFRKTISASKPQLSALSVTDQILKPSRLKVRIEPPNFQLIQGTQLPANATRDDVIKVINPSKDHNIDIAIDSSAFKNIPYWKVEVHMNVSNAKTSKGDRVPFDFAGAPLSPPITNPGSEKYYQIATFYSPNLEGTSFGVDPSVNTQTTSLSQSAIQAQPNTTFGQTNLFETQLWPRSTDPTRAFLTGDTSGKFGLSYAIPVQFFDMKYKFTIILYSLYNAPLSPANLVARVAGFMRNNFTGINRLIKIGGLVTQSSGASNQYASQSYYDTLFGEEINGFNQLTLTPLPNTEILLKLLQDPNLPIPIPYALNGNFVNIGQAYTYPLQQAIYSIARVYLFDEELPYSQAVLDTDFVNFGDEVYRFMKKGQNPSGGFWIDENGNGNGLQDRINKRLSNFQSKFNQVVGTPCDFEKMDQFTKVVIPALPAKSGKSSILGKIGLTQSGIDSGRKHQTGLGIQQFQLNRWLTYSLGEFFPCLLQFIDKLRKAFNNINVVFPTLNSPYLNFVNGIFNELNKIISTINDVLKAIDDILKVLEILSAEGILALRIEDEVGLGFSTGGNEAIKNIILNSPGLPEYLKDTGGVATTGGSIVATGGIAGEAQLQYAQQQATNQRNQQLENNTFPGLGVDTAFSASNNIKPSAQSDSFTAMITILAAAPSIQKDLNDISSAYSSFLDFTQSIAQEAQISSLEASLVPILSQLAGLQVEQSGIQFEIDNINKDVVLTPTEKNAQIQVLQGQLQGVMTNTTNLQKQQSNIQMQINNLQMQLQSQIANENSQSSSNNTNANPVPVTPLESTQAAVVSALFDWIETFLLQTIIQDKENQINQFSAAVAQDAKNLEILLIRDYITYLGKIYDEWNRL